MNRIFHEPENKCSQQQLNPNSVSGDLEISVLYSTVQKSVLSTNNVYIHNHIFFIIYLFQSAIRLAEIDQIKSQTHRERESIIRGGKTLFKWFICPCKGKKKKKWVNADIGPSVLRYSTGFATDGAWAWAFCEVFYLKEPCRLRSMSQQSEGRNSKSLGTALWNNTG